MATATATTFPHLYEGTASYDAWKARQTARLRGEAPAETYATLMAKRAARLAAWERQREAESLGQWA
jgi:hypothetical protein